MKDKKPRLRRGEVAKRRPIQPAEIDSIIDEIAGESRAQTAPDDDIEDQPRPTPASIQIVPSEPDFSDLEMQFDSMEENKQRLAGACRDRVELLASMRGKKEMTQDEKRMFDVRSKLIDAVQDQAEKALKMFNKRELENKDKADTIRLIVEDFTQDKPMVLVDQQL